MHTRSGKLVVMTGILAVAGIGLTSQAVAGGGGKETEAFIDHQLKMMDTNGDQKVNADEHAAGVRKMFETMDVSKDGKVTAEEMAATHEQVTGQKAKKVEMSAAAKIKVCDTDKDGALTVDEHNGCAKAMFGKMDGNKDGELTRAELVNGLSKLHHGNHKDMK